MFTHMESLPISYFDQNEFGDIMSRYTNDIDTLMQMISQSIPQFTNSALSLLFVVCAMFSLSWQLTLFSFIIFALSIGIVRFLTVKSGNYFQIQQKKLGQINGYNEEMLNGLKVIKVFSHEPESKAGLISTTKNCVRLQVEPTLMPLFFSQSWVTLVTCSTY